MISNNSILHIKKTQKTSHVNYSKISEISVSFANVTFANLDIESHFSGIKVTK